MQCYNLKAVYLATTQQSLATYVPQQPCRKDQLNTSDRLVNVPMHICTHTAQHTTQHACQDTHRHTDTHSCAYVSEGLRMGRFQIRFQICRKFAKYFNTTRLCSRVIYPLQRLLLSVASNKAKVSHWALAWSSSRNRLDCSMSSGCFL